MRKRCTTAPSASARPTVIATLLGFHSPPLPAQQHQSHRSKRQRLQSAAHDHECLLVHGRHLEREWFVADVEHLREHKPYPLLRNINPNRPQPRHQRRRSRRRHAVRYPPLNAVPPEVLTSPSANFPVPSVIKPMTSAGSLACRRRMHSAGLIARCGPVRIPKPPPQGAFTPAVPANPSPSPELGFPRSRWRAWRSQSRNGVRSGYAKFVVSSPIQTTNTLP